MCLAVSLGSAWQGWERGEKGGRGQTAPRSHELCCRSPFPSPHLAGGRRKEEGGRRVGGREEGGREEARREEGKR